MSRTADVVNKQTVVFLPLRRSSNVSCALFILAEARWSMLPYPVNVETLTSARSIA
jgi:hypothetical protein